MLGDDSEELGGLSRKKANKMMIFYFVIF